MRIIFLGQACYLIEIDGKRVLTDPWLTDPIFEGLIERQPPFEFGVGDLPPLDLLAITHGHLDHFNAPTLAQLPDKSIPVVHPPVRFTDLDQNLRRLGFSDLHARKDYEPFVLDTVSITPTPSRGVLDECAYLISGKGGSFWNGADAPQEANVIEENFARLGSVDVGGFCHNSFDQPALLGLRSHKDPDHGPISACRSAEILQVGVAIPGASSMHWRGPRGKEITQKVVRRNKSHFFDQLQKRGSKVQGVDLNPGDAWSREGGVEHGVLIGTPVPQSAHDYIHAFLSTGETWSDGHTRPSVDDTFRRDLPRRLCTDHELAKYIDQSVHFHIVGDDRADYIVDFPNASVRQCDAHERTGFAVTVVDEDWKDLFERKINWQVLLVSDRLRVTNFQPGRPPDGLHFVYALQALFP